MNLVIIFVIIVTHWLILELFKNICRKRWLITKYLDTILYVCQKKRIEVMNLQNIYIYISDVIHSLFIKIDWKMYSSWKKNNVNNKTDSNTNNECFDKKPKKNSYLYTFQRLLHWFICITNDNNHINIFYKSEKI